MTSSSFSKIHPFSGPAPAMIALAAFLLVPLFCPRAHAQDTATLYKQKCAVCHAADGSGNTAKGRKVKAKDLRSPEVQKESDATLAGIIAKGKAPNMDGYADELTKAQIQSLVAYIRELAKK